ncbi:MAG: metallophosphoesterase family protein [Myxococcales bacterium]|nr:metallophosphoesterase family protein [Myxococcales bacterium]MCB9550326.1 metallophosphoesterase family protein [Myxococcales bacterium]
MPDATNLLIVSDLHLGGSLRPPTGAPPDAGVGFTALRQVVRLDRELARFIDHHRRHRDPATRAPWTLLFNGDTIDFLHMDLRPAGDDGPAPADDEALYGLSFAADRAIWKMRVIARYHRRTFAALARFAEDGHRVVLVVGNHDVDLWFAEVRSTFVDAVAAHARDPAAVRAAIRFEPWFHYEPGRVYLEHGHRFDPYATFPDPLAPLAADRDAHLAPNFGHFGLRYFCNRVRTFPVHDLDTWTLGDLWRWTRRHTARELGSATWQTFLFVWHYARATARDRLSRSGREATTRARRRARLRKFAARYGLPLGRVVALDELRRPHVGQSLARLAHGLMLDRVALIALAIAGLLTALTTDDAATGAWLAAGVVGGSALAWWHFDRTRPSAHIHPELDRIARRVGRLSQVPVVVFGHTHRPVLRRVGRVWWLNPGSWEHLPRQRLHAPDVPCDCHAQFGVVTGRGPDTRPHLRRWCRRIAAPIEA